MAKTGRPRALDEIKQREVCALVSAGFTLPAAGRYVECTANTIRREAKRNPEFGEQLRKSELAAKLEPLRALRNKAQTHWRAAAWMLERLEPEQFAKYESKLLTPEEVGDLLQNISDTLDRILRDQYDLIMARAVVDAAQEQANLPCGRRNVYARLNDVPTPGIPTGFDLLQDAMRPIEPQEEEDAA